jgi:hypothetical protein
MLVFLMVDLMKKHNNRFVIDSRNSVFIMCAIDSRNPVFCLCRRLFVFSRYEVAP